MESCFGTVWLIFKLTLGVLTYLLFNVHINASWFFLSLLKMWTDVLYMAHNFIKKSELTRIHVGQQWNNFLLLSQVESLRFRSLSHIFYPFLLAIDQCASYIHGMRSIIKGVHHKPQWNFKYQQVWEMTHDFWTLLEIDRVNRNMKENFFNIQKKKLSISNSVGL